MADDVVAAARAIAAAADSIPCPVCAATLRQTPPPVAGELVATAQISVLIASVRMAAHMAAGHPAESTEEGS